MRQKYYADIANAWNVMVENARPVLGSLGPAASRHEVLGQKMGELIRLNEEAEGHRSELARVVKLRKEAATLGNNVFRRFAADLQAHHGFDSAELIRYGLQPKGRARKKKDPAAAKPKAKAGAPPADAAA